jgi:tRNA dimethylallyltransferase
MTKKLPSLIVILGATASGKTKLAIELAKKYNGEIISADSRQVYKKMDIGTAKPIGKWESYCETAAYMVEGVPHYLIDIVDPGEIFSVSNFKQLALERIDDILKRGKTPFIVGGTGLYIWSVVDNLILPDVAPHKKLRNGLEDKSLDELVVLLKKLDPESAKVIDLNNSRRVIRALEVNIMTGGSFIEQKQKNPPLFNALQIGLRVEREKLYERIDKRVDEQISAGLVGEVEGLIKQKYSFSLPSMNGIGYRQIGAYLNNEMDLEKAIDLVKRDTRHYARRQLTWFRRDKRIEWCAMEEKEEIDNLIEDFLDKKTNE